MQRQDAAPVTSSLELSSNRHEFGIIRSPDAPETEGFADEIGVFGYVHSLETGSLVDGPGVRATLFLAGCMLRCQYCHNPDTWHLKRGTRVTADAAIARLSDFGPALRSMSGGLTISGGEPLVQIGFTSRVFAAAKKQSLHTALDTSGFLGARADDAYLSQVDLVLLDIKSFDPVLYHGLTGVDLSPTLRFAERLAALGKPVWVRYVLVPGLTDTPAHIRALARFLAPMRNVEWIEVLPFHQMGAFKWRRLGLDYPLEGKAECTAAQIEQAVALFRGEGCQAR